MNYQSPIISPFLIDPMNLTLRAVCFLTYEIFSEEKFFLSLLDIDHGLVNETYTIRGRLRALFCSILSDWFGKFYSILPHVGLQTEHSI